ncbi:unnamed protein product [Soboliphyme baturini]|uniref:DZF domain-containing protein n=1 Tax=Soboliphyme baturini TaxID=241478 RepID=A0A183IX37_9BILA|nr:unnamed protein product [Soboliphyme baturini]
MADRQFSNQPAVQAQTQAQLLTQFVVALILRQLDEPRYLCSAREDGRPDKTGVGGGGGSGSRRGSDGGVCAFTT